MKYLKRIDPTKDPLFKSVIYLAIPMMLEMVAQNFFNLVDMYFVSKISYFAIGALVSSSIILMVVFSIIIGLSTATGMYISSFWGARKFSRAYFYYVNSLSVVLLLGVVFGVLLYLFLNPVLYLVGLKSSTRIYAYQYLTVASLGIVFSFLFSLNNSALRSCALPELVVKVMILANILNAIFDPLFIFYFKLGIRGAAVSTIASVVLGIFLQLYYLRKTGFYYIFKIKMKVLRKLVGKGVFASLHLLIRIVSMLVLIRIVSGFSQMALAAYSVVIRIYQVLLFLVFGLANVSFVIVGQNYGAKLVERAKRGAFTVIITAIFFIGSLDVLIYLLRGAILPLFVSSANVMVIAESVMLYYFISYPFVVVATISARSSMALHDTKRPSLINLFNLWFFMLPLAYFLSRLVGVEGVWQAIAISNFTSFVANAVVLLMNFRRVKNEVACI